MAFDTERLLRLWTRPLPADDAAAAAAFRELYTDPVEVNGTPLRAADLVDRARAMQRALEDPEREVLAVVDAGTSVAVAFRLAGRQVGELGTPAGPLPATGRRIDLRVVDLLTLTDGRISAIWMVADWLGALAGADAIRLGPGTPAQRGGSIVPSAR
jgi:predicted ester cyclase